MAKLILKCPYIKGGTKKKSAHLSNMVKYVATRDGVELLPSGSELKPRTEKQEKFIQELLQEFPDIKDSYEFEDYLSKPNQKNASDFISFAMEENAHKLVDSEKYLDYIANRPRVEKHGTHGLFSYYGTEEMVLKQVMEEVANHEGNIWLPIISLKREDAQRCGFDSAEPWKALLNEKIVEIADHFKIKPENLKWYAAFHDEGHHPHVHMVVYSSDPKEGYLTKEGLKKMKSSLATAIFQQDLLPLYEAKTQNRDQLKEQARESMIDLIQQIKSGVDLEPRTVELIEHLARELKTAKGKKQYGYLPPKMKNLVDEIVNQLGKIPEVEECYELWWQTQQQINLTYSDDTKEKPSLSQCKDFKSIKNMVIQEAMKYDTGGISFEEATEPIGWDDMSAEPPEEMAVQWQGESEIPEEPSKPKSKFWESSPKNWWNKDFKEAKKFLYGNEKENILQDFEKAFEMFAEQETNPLAQLELAKMFEKGLGCEVDTEKARECEEEAFSLFMERETEKPWQYTQYRIGKMYATGTGVQQDYEKAVEFLTKAYEANPEKQLLFSSRLEEIPRRRLEGGIWGKLSFPQKAGGGFILNTLIQEKTSQFSPRKAKISHEKALDGFVKMEKQGEDDKLQYRLGKMFLEGKGTEVDVEKAKEYFEKSAKVGNQYACYQLARLLLKEEHPDLATLEKAVEFLEVAANAGNEFAQYQLGKLLADKESPLFDEAKAVKCLTKSAEQGNEFAQYALGKVYLDKDSPFYDVEKAVEWLTKSADQGNQYAQYTLGKLYFFGEEIPQDKEKAWDYLNQSAQQGNEYAQFYVNHFHTWGQPSIPFQVGQLLNQLSKVFEENLPPLPHKARHRLDRKRMLQLAEKKQAQGQKRDDFSQQTNY